MELQLFEQLRLHNKYVIVLGMDLHQTFPSY